MSELPPGLVFAAACRDSVAVGVMTEYVPKLGHLIWIADPVFEAEPSLERAKTIDRWRWPVFFPLAAALRRQLVVRLGVIPIPNGLQHRPLMRSRAGPNAWREVNGAIGDSSRAGRLTDDRSLPIYQIVNDTMLREMVDTNWTSSDTW